MAGGFQLSRTHSQGDVTGKQFTYAVDSGHGTLLAPGDVLRITTAGSNTDGTPLIDTGVTDTANTGVLFSVDPIFSGEALSETGLPVGTGGTVKVNVDPNALYEVDVSNGPITAANVGFNVPLVATTASTLGGLSVSNMTVNNTGIAVTATLPFRVVELLEDENGVLGNRALVRVNESTVAPGATGI